MKWNSNLSVKNDKIDHQHQTLLQTLDNLLAACNQGKGNEELIHTLDFLAEYTVSHFKDEEAYMAANGFPGLPDHKAVHDAFIAEVGSLVQRIKSEGVSLPLVIEVNGKLNAWIIEHIMQMDMEYYKFIDSK